MLRLLILLLALSGHTYAATDVRGAQDLDLIERFPRSYIVQYEQSEDYDYRLVLGGLEKINGVLAPEKQQLINGNLTRITYRIPDNHTPDEAFDYITGQLMGLGAEAQFLCAGRECGSSNQWANNILKYSRLYGVDSTQQFAAFKLANKYFSIYSVRRGNKRVYLRLDQLQSSKIELTDALEYGIQTEYSGYAQLQLLAEYLKSHAGKRIWIISRNSDPGTKQEQLDRSLDAAQMVKQQLLESGVPEQQISVHALGSFSTDPRESNVGIFIVTEDI